MPPVTKPCPGCQRPLIYRSDGGGRVCCPECGHVIWLTNRAGPPTLPMAPAPRARSWAAQVVVDGRTADLQAEQEKTAADPAPQPLGPEPAPASYGLLQGVAYAVLAFNVAVGTLQFIEAILHQPVGGSPFFGSGLQQGWAQVLVSVLDLAACILRGLLLIQVVNQLCRLDRRALWLAWRAGGLPRAPGPPPGSNLPYLLPCCVPGGVLVILWVAVLNSAESFPVWMRDTRSACIFLALGVMVFLVGLGAGEMHRFFWRMSELGLALGRRTRGGELSLGPARPAQALPARRGVAGFILAAGGLLLAGAVLILVQILDLYGSLTRARGGTSDDLFIALGFGLIFLLALLGGVYTLYRLTLVWRDTLVRWEWVEKTICILPASPPGENAAGIFQLAAFLTAGLLTVLGGIAALQIVSETGGAPFSMGAGALGLFCCLSALAAVPAWLAFLKRDTTQFLRAAAASRVHHIRPAASQRTERLAAWVVVVAFAQLLMVAYFLLGLLGNLGGAFLMFAAITLLATIAAVVLPSCWWALVCLDLDRAAACLEACREVSDADAAAGASRSFP